MNNMNNFRGEPMLPGLKPAMELLRDNPDKISKILVKKNWHSNEAQTLLSLAQKNGISIKYEEAKNLDQIAGKNISHQGIIALLSRATPIPFEELLNNTGPLPLFLALDQIQDPGNLGAISRTAYALGISGLILTRRNSASISPGAYRSSAGALGKMPVSYVMNLGKSLDLAEEKGFQIYGSIAEMDTPKGMTLENAWNFKWHLPAILVLGNENHGIRPGIIKRCMQFVTIPFAREFDSLNIAQAGAILMSLCARQHCQE